MKRAEETGVGVVHVGAPEGSVVHRFAHQAMATVFEVRCAHDDPGYARQAAHAAFDLLDRLEQELSRFVPNSDVSRINELRPGEGTRVSPWTMECLRIARSLFERTFGAFDVSLGSGLDRLELDPDGFTVRAGADGVRLDLGGIGKGYAVDRMAELLAEWGVDRALVHGGFSSVLALLPPPGREGWPLTLSAPWPAEQKVLARLSASLMALSASGTRKGGHIVDPSTGRAAHGKAAWAAFSLAARPERPVTPSPGPDIHDSPAAVAEGFSTAFMILPRRDIEDICRRCPGLQAWLATKPAEGEGPATTLLHLAPRDESPRDEG
jgi:thiamine biosynthesis lipoprotein